MNTRVFDMNDTVELNSGGIIGYVNNISKLSSYSTDLINDSFRSGTKSDKQKQKKILHKQ